LEAIAGDRREGEEEEGEVADPDEAVRQQVEGKVA
jgi:hypothetical protein